MSYPAYAIPELEDFTDCSREKTSCHHGTESVRKGKENSGVRRTQTEP
jgi:hypothetical protein